MTVWCDFCGNEIPSGRGIGVDLFAAFVTGPAEREDLVTRLACKASCVRGFLHSIDASALTSRFALEKRTSRQLHDALVENRALREQLAVADNNVIQVGARMARALAAGNDAEEVRLRGLGALELMRIITGRTQ
jgi:hypothetical protein